MPPKATKKMLIPGLMALILMVILFTFFSLNKTEQEFVADLTPPSKEDVQQEVIDAEPEHKVLTEQDVEKSAAVEAQPVQDTAVPEVIQQPPQIPVAEIKFTEGVDYITKFPDEQPKTPILVEFFSYMCPHCYNFEQTMIRWKKQKPENIELLKIPVSFGRDDWQLSAKAFYIAEELQIIDDFSAAMFKTIHFDKKPPATLADVEQIFIALGIKKSDFNKAAKSFNIDSKLRKADFLTRKFKVPGVPYFLINFKYELGSASLESEESLFRLWNNLPEKEFIEE